MMIQNRIYIYIYIYIYSAVGSLMGQSSALPVLIYVNDLAFVSTELFTTLFAGYSNMFAQDRMPKMS